MTVDPRTVTPSRRDHRWLNLAARVAARSDCTQKMGAVLVIGGRPVSARPNRMRHHPAVVPNGPCSVHAEMNTLNGAVEKRGGTMYVARLLRRTRFGDARPCDDCVTALIDAGVSRVVWTTTTGFGNARPRVLLNPDYNSGTQS